MTDTGSLLTSLECRACCTTVDPERPVGTCPTCGHTLLAAYRLDRLDGPAWWDSLLARPPMLWRYAELLPVRRAESIVTLGEGYSPIVRLRNRPEFPGLTLLAKSDDLLPTGSFKARGMAVAVSRASELGLRDLYVPSAGNAGIALAAYGARAGLRVRIYLPDRTAPTVIETCRAYGADVVTVPGTIREAGATARSQESGHGGFDMSTLREPYRVEGKKTMGFEIVEQCRAGTLPDAIVYPAGGGTGLVGMYKAFTELRTLGVLDRMPRLYAVQPEGCAPVVRALRDGASAVTPWDHPSTVAPGLLVPAPFASERILEAIRGSGGGGTTVSDDEILRAMEALAGEDGVWVSPEAAAPRAALPRLVREGALRSGETVLLYHTGSGLPFSLGQLRASLDRGPP